MKAIITTAALGAALIFAATVSVGAQGTGGSPGHHKGGPMMMTRCPGGYVLNAVGGSGESGCATPRAGDLMTFLAIKVTGEPAGAKQPSHIHRGKCGSNGPVVLPLTPVVGGKSTTNIRLMQWNKYKNGGFYINIHESADNIPHIVSCADITAMHPHGAM